MHTRLLYIYIYNWGDSHKVLTDNYATLLWIGRSQNQMHCAPVIGVETGTQICFGVGGGGGGRWNCTEEKWNFLWMN